MKLIVDTTSGSLFSTKHGPSFSIDVHYMDTVLMLKQRIEKSQGIPVFKQTLFLQGKVLQDDHYYLQNLLPYYSSRLLLSISPEDNPNQNNNDQVPQTEQSPSNPVLEFANNQGWPVMSNNDQVLKIKEPPKKEFFRIQDSTEGKNKQVLHQTEQSPLPSNQRYRPLQMITASRTNNGYSLDELLAPRELPPVTVGSRRNRDQEVVQTEKSSPSDSVKETLAISDSPVNKKMKTSQTNLTVFVQLLEIMMIFPLKVNANDKVEKLRKKLVKLQEKGALNLPQEEYHFKLRDKRLSEYQSFSSNLVADGDIIVINRNQSSANQA